MGAREEPARSGGYRKKAGEGSTRAQSSSRPADNAGEAGVKKPPASRAAHSAGPRKAPRVNPVCASKKPLNQKELDRRIKECRAALHRAIQRAGDKPLSECPEVLRLSKKLDGLIDQVQKKR